MQSIQCRTDQNDGCCGSTKKIKTTEKLQQPWLNKHITQQHKIKNNHYHVWVKYKQAHQWTAYKTERNIYNRPCMYHKMQTMSKKILEKKNKQLLKIVNKVTNNNQHNQLLVRNPEELAE